ncbi:MAG TPA: metallopeptidase family protein [Actinomycetota bacterium]|nr:metallopeptidase family protein [Actinomycetota bacterium]
MEREAFEDLVADAVDSIPDEFAEALVNVDVVVEDEPSQQDLDAGRVPPGHTLFGLYHGIPLTKRGNHYDRVLPDRISIYRGPIVRALRDPDRIKEQVRRTVIHEIGHYFGIEEDRLHELGWG